MSEEQSEEQDAPVDSPELELSALNYWWVEATIKQSDGTETTVKFRSVGQREGDGVGLIHLKRFIEARLEAAKERVRS